MNIQVIIDWRFWVVVAVLIFSIYFVKGMDNRSKLQLVECLIDLFKENKIAKIKCY